MKINNDVLVDRNIDILNFKGTAFVISKKSNGLINRVGNSMTTTVATLEVIN